MYGYIYFTTNLINGKQYIGKHKSSEFDTFYKGSGVALKRAMDKYGEENFRCELIESFNSREELNEAEIRYIAEYDAVNSPDFYNIASGGEGGDTFSGMSRELKEEFRLKSSASWSTHTYEDRCRNISVALTGRTKSQEHRNKISETCIKNETHKGSKNGMYGVDRSGELAPNFGRHYYNNGEIEYLLYEDVYESNYKDKGFVKGRLQWKLDALHKDLSKRLQGNTYNKGKIRIHKDDLERCIRPEELDKFLQDGWVRGRRPKQVG